MNDNEKLVEEAAAKRYPHRNVFLEGMAYMTEERSRLPLREAFVEGAKWRAEKAHTPTDDERDERFVTDADLDRFEATATPIYRSTFEAERASKFLVSDLGQWIIRLVAEVRRLRRSEAPEPTVEEWAARIRAARAKAIAKGYTPEHDAKHGVRHLLNWAIDYARRGKPEDSSGLVAAAMDLAEIAYAELERLRHVADTMSAVSTALRTRYASDSQAAYFMRQINAALEAVPEPQGEPSDAQVLSAARAFAAHGLTDRESVTSLPDWRFRDVLGPIRAALRAAGGVQ
jgi:hypothetical protein